MVLFVIFAIKNDFLLAKLKEQGVVTEEEFLQMKKSILTRMEKT
jgi:hypothetical protein